MSKGIGGIKGYHSGGGVTHTHGSKKNKEKKKALQAMTSNKAYQGSGTSQATQAKKKMGQSYKDMYSDMASVGIKNLSGATTGDKAGKDAQQKQRDAGFKPIADYDQGLYTIGAGDPPPKDDKPPKEDKKEQVKYYDDELGELSERDLFLLEKKLGQKAIIRNGKIFFVDTTGSVVPAFAMMDKLSGTLDKLTGFNPSKTFGDMGDTGKAALFNKISNMSGEEFQDFLNRKGNLDRIMDYAGTLSPTQNAKLMDMVKTGDVSGFAGLIKGQGGEGFDKALLKIQNPQKYWELNPPRTSGDLEEAARAGISWIPGYGPVDMPEGHSGQFQQQAGGVGDILPPPTTDPNIPTPDYYLRRQYMPQNVTGFTPDYTGGPEQMHIAGGWWDPTGKKWLGSPWGTQNQFQFNQGGIVGTNPLLFKNQGGMASDNGIKSFKKYGY